MIHHYFQNLQVVTGVRCKIVGARLTGFATGIALTGAAKNTRIQDCNFSGVTTDIADSGVNTALSNNLNEVP